MPSFKERKQWLLVFYSPRQSEGRPEEESLFTFKLLRQCYWPGTRAWKRRECVCAAVSRTKGSLSSAQGLQGVVGVLFQGEAKRGAP